jgi:hypothetical protein
MSERFTIVFEGDIRKLPFNPLKTETIYGRPIASAIGDALAEPDDVIEDLVAALAALREIAFDRHCRDLRGTAERALAKLEGRS